jgi:hypothetical protein
MINVGVLMTNYCAWPLSERGIREVLRWSGEHITRIVVVDDASDAPESFAGHPNVLIRRNSENLGYVRSVNVGMRLMSDDVVLVLDCDAHPVMDLVPGILKHFEGNAKLGALGLFEAGKDGRTRIAGEAEPTLPHFLLGQALGESCARRGWFLGKRFVLHSCCMVVRRNAFEEVGGFDEEFDFLDADTDFSMRLQDAGWQVATDSGLRCYHEGSGSPQAISRRVVRYHRNRWRLLQKHGKLRFPFACRILLGLRHLSEFAALTAMKSLRVRPAADVDDKLTGRRELLRTVLANYGS